MGWSVSITTGGGASAVGFEQNCHAISFRKIITPYYSIQEPPKPIYMIDPGFSLEKKSDKK